MNLYNNFKILTRHDWFPFLFTMSDEEDSLALINAMQNRKTLDEIRELIRSGIDVNTQCKIGQTALIQAAQYGGEHGAGMMKVLVDSGADVDKQNELGWTALMMAAGCGGEHGAGMIKILLDAKADVNTQEEDGRTALMYAAAHGGEHGAGMMRLLLDAGADANHQDRNGQTALMYVAEHRGELGAGMMRVLVDAKADVNKQSKLGWTALMWAAEHGGEHAVTMVRVLVTCGATLPPGKKLPSKTLPELAGYIHGARNWTPLHRAADARDADAIIKCLSEGMRPDAVVESSHQDMRTALSIAESTSYPTSQPVCDDCLALLRPSLVKCSAPSDSLFGGGGGGGAQTET
jgi:hypothetical protein